LRYYLSFLANELEDLDDRQWVATNKRLFEQQKQEFQEMDEDGDGFLTKDELLVGISFLYIYIIL
jgi:Ca2+-binding EF-hand superfamily protein